MSGAVEEPAGDGEQRAVHGAGDSEMSGVDNMSEVGGPTHQIVGDPRADQPAAVGGEVPEGDMGQGEVFEVFDGELDRRMVAVKGVDIVDVAVEVGEPRLFTPPWRITPEVSEPAARPPDLGDGGRDRVAAGR